MVDPIVPIARTSEAISGFLAPSASGCGREDNRTWRQNELRFGEGTAKMDQMLRSCPSYNLTSPSGSTKVFRGFPTQKPTRKPARSEYLRSCRAPPLVRRPCLALRDLEIIREVLPQKTTLAVGVAGQVARFQHRDLDGKHGCRLQAPSAGAAVVVLPENPENP